MSYKKTSTTLAIAVIAALIVSASVVIALTTITEGVGISAANAQVRERIYAHLNLPKQA
ncbi:MAG TPA: hypothetical protein VEL70_08545 [Candidatus Acidoferrum sp.]|nr:hypothetical protein [Candidatus Acidoferrum sp.]